MPLKISSLSVMAGTPACNLRCPYCISKTTFRVEVPPKTEIPLERISFLANKFLRVADGLPYGIITGKGEPTLAKMEEIGGIIDVLNTSGLIPELQTNGTLLTPENLTYWKERGLNTVALSCVSHVGEVNSQMLSGGTVTWNLGNIVAQAKELGLLTRLTVIMSKGGIDSSEAFFDFLKWAKEVGGHQVTFRKMGQPRNLVLPGSQKVADWISANYVPPQMALEALTSCPDAKEQDPLPWSRRFSFNGMSVVISECITPPKDSLARSAIIQPDGHLYLSWDDPADIAV